MRKFIKKFKNSIIGKILKAIWKTLWLILEIIMVFIAIVIITQRVTSNEKAFLGFRIFSVATGSMEPEYAVGDILIAREKDPSTIVVGDNIVYLGNVADYRGKIITHNVIEVEQNEEGDYLFHTKGIANSIEDPVVHEDQLYGVIFYNNEFLAGLCKILTNRYGLYFFVIVPIIIYFFVGLIKSRGERIEQEREEERARREKQKRKSKKQVEQEIIEEVQEEEKIVREEVITENTKQPKNRKTANTKKENSSQNGSNKEKESTTKKRAKVSETKASKTKDSETKTTRAKKTQKNDESLIKTPKTKKAKEE